MSEVQRFLIETARDYLITRVLSLCGAANQEEAFVGWLLGKDYLKHFQVGQAAAKASGATGANRSYHDVAVLGYALSCLPPQPEWNDALDKGIRWLTGRVAFSQAIASFEVDGIALLGIALGIKRTGHDGGRKWMADFLSRSSRARVSSFDHALVSAAAAVIGCTDVAPMPSDEDIADIRTALQSLGVNILAKPNDPMAALRRITSGQNKGEPAARLAAQLRALDNILLDACALDLQRPTVEQVVRLLDGVPASMKRWQWDAKSGRADKGHIRWDIQNEKHVQSLLWVVLAPLFPDLEDEENLPSLGHKHPRYDLGIPSLQVIIEVKFVREGTQAEFARVTEELAADHTLYLREGSGYSKIIALIWDDSSSTDQHHELKQGISKMPGVVGTIVVVRPGRMTQER